MCSDFFFAILEHYLTFNEYRDIVELEFDECGLNKKCTAPIFDAIATAKAAITLRRIAIGGNSLEGVLCLFLTIDTCKLSIILLLPIPLVGRLDGIVGLCQSAQLCPD